jgi:hypothetical protein
MYCSDTFATEVSSNSINVARVTTPAMSQGLNAGFAGAANADASAVVVGIEVLLIGP